MFVRFDAVRTGERRLQDSLNARRHRPDSTGAVPGYAACFHSALKRVAASQKITLTDTAITVDVGIGPLPTGGFGLTVAIAAELPGLDEITALSAMDNCDALPLAYEIGTAAAEKFVKPEHLGLDP